MLVAGPVSDPLRSKCPRPQSSLLADKDDNKNTHLANNAHNEQKSWWSDGESADLLNNNRSFSVSTAKLFLVLPQYYLWKNTWRRLDCSASTSIDQSSFVFSMFFGPECLYLRNRMKGGDRGEEIACNVHAARDSNRLTRQRSLYMGCQF